MRIKSSRWQRQQRHKTIHKSPRPLLVDRSTDQIRLGNCPTGRPVRRVRCAVPIFGVSCAPVHGGNLADKGATRVRGDVIAAHIPPAARQRDTRRVVFDPRYRLRRAPARNVPRVIAACEDGVGKLQTVSVSSGVALSARYKPATAGAKQ